MALACALVGISSSAQIVLNQTQAPTTLVQNVLIGTGIFPSNVTFNGAPGNTVANVGIGPSEIGRFNGANTCLGLVSGVFLCPGVAQVHLPGPNDRLNRFSGGMGFGPAGMPTPDLDLSHLTKWENWRVSGGNNIYNKANLEFDFVPLKDMVSFRYVFSSEEYERWACSQYNDVFGWFISGPGIPTNINGPFTNNAMNIAFIPGSLKPVAINTVNSGRTDASNANGPDFTDLLGPCFAADSNWQANARYYRYNGGLWPFPQPPDGVAQLDAPYNTAPYYIEHNGMTVVLTASAAVQCGETYHMKMGVANVGDSNFPSAVFLEKESFKSTNRFSMDVMPGPTVEARGTDTVFIESNCDSVYLRFHRWGGFYLDEDLEIATSGTSTAGVDYLPIPTKVHFNQLDSMVVLPLAIPVDSDGVESLVVDIVTCAGSRHVYMIDQRPPLEVILEDQALTCPGRIDPGPAGLRRLQRPCRPDLPLEHRGDHPQHQPARPTDHPVLGHRHRQLLDTPSDRQRLGDRTPL
ncbi:MAG: choice-of-anchor L domain-containing protein [Flavobacteriales bacterium]